MSRRTPEKTRKAVAADVRTGELSVRAIAKKHGIGVATVAKIAADFGLTLERSGAKTAHASKQRTFDAKAARAALNQRLYGLADQFLDRATEPYTVIVGTGASTQLVTLKQPPLRDAQAAVTSAGICMDKALVLEAKDDDQGAEHGKTMLGDLMGLLGAAYEQITAEEQTAAGPPPTGER